jgi:gamma-glutamyltranspeptidase/glutathione hydrolase
MAVFDPRQPYATRRSPVLAKNVVATSQPLAAQAGVQALARGGNAVDAALAAAITLTVVEPTGNGLGSDAFALVWDGGGLHGLNASGRAPAAWTPDRFAGREAFPVLGPDAVTVPGAVSAWVALSRRFGRLPFADLFPAAIRYARDGWHVSPVIGALWERAVDRLRDQPGFADVFLRDGRAPVPGELFRAPQMAATLEAIAQSDGEAFYRGDVARATADWVQRHGGGLALADLERHRADWVEPLDHAGLGGRLAEIPPNGQGIAAQIALGLLAHTDVADHDPDGVPALHLQIEAMKLALADLDAHVGDPATMRLGPADLLDDAYLAERAKRIDPRRAGDPGAGAPRPGGTVYLTAADDEGRMISFIQSNYMGFGSGVVVPSTGVSLQNRGAGFTLEAGHPNEVGPDKRPFHTIIPGFLRADDGAPRMSFGVMGGPMQAQGHVQMVLRTQLWGQNPQAASDAPRWRATGGRGVALEVGFAPEVYEGLAALGHGITVEPPDAAFGFGGAQLVAKVPDGYIAGSDGRKDGCALGF